MAREKLHKARLLEEVVIEVTAEALELPVDLQTYLAVATCEDHGAAHHVREEFGKVLTRLAGSTAGFLCLDVRELEQLRQWLLVAVDLKSAEVEVGGLVEKGLHSWLRGCVGEVHEVHVEDEDSRVGCDCRVKVRRSPQR